MLKFRRTILCLPLLVLAGAAHAQGKLEAHYQASLAGLPIGKGSWVIDIGDAHYTAAASGATTGLIKVFVGGSGTGAVQGTLANGKSVASNYSATIKSGKHTEEIRMTVAAGNVKEFKIDPPEDPNPKRIPVTDEHRRGVLDPMTSSLAVVPGTGELTSPQVCNRTLAVFDGKMRYDLKLAYKRTETVKAEKGYAGPAVVCSVAFTPVSGFIPSRAAIKYLIKSRDIEVWLAPIAGTRVLVPFRAQVGTPFGQGVVEATRFIAVAGASHASKPSKTQ
ncbi:MAG TPA: DUF3108 domain-containing protein [Pseudolabrys sp.]|jgi:hypothetical protein|nr:DUF3108 domain-containing protein [Pseudolabrys sp.]